MKPPMPEFIRADARALPLPNGSVDLVVTSPPYFGLRDYGYDGQIGAEPTPTKFLDSLIACTAEMMRVLKPSGSIFVNLGDKYAGGGQGGNVGGNLGKCKGGNPHLNRTNPPVARVVPTGARAKSLLLLPERFRIRCVDELGLVARAVIIWSKANGLPESVTDRVRRSHEDWVHLTKQPRYYSAVGEIRQATDYTGRTWQERKAAGVTWTPGIGTRGTHLVNDSAPNSDMAPNSLGKLPGSVWEVATQPLHVPAELGTDHFAAFPMALPRRIIQGWSPRDVCTACGEGRRPVTHSLRELNTAKNVKRVNASGGVLSGGTERSTLGDAKRAPSAQIVGYACACPDTSAPSRPGAVLDPFAGTGTAPLVATMLGRRGVGVELSADYIRLAQWRASDPRERARAAGLYPDAVARLRPELPGQADLFEAVDCESDGGAA